ncbi:hypothetical protein [Haloparvum sedimenti]|uniref:hypothetical protein n=1 Tax=Haloparvum sedimenti TaxID=1678448 RepID=UPI00071E9A36|nr:hypothetical protein [Haloparvum sedimenti]
MQATTTGDPWQAPPMSDGPVATITGTGGGGTTAGGGTTETDRPLSADVETTAVGTSPLTAWLESTRWSREDLKLLADLLGALGTIGALWLAIERGAA